ncbi:MAG: M20 family metallopeptidase [Erysipelotrichaceae bacterium]|nr:M20 family metallopeptidase [Erysipelotrichaceae bacterium]
MNIERYLNELEQLVNIDCGSHNPEGITKVADKLENWYREIGWHIERHDLGPKTGPLLVISNHPNCDHYDFMLIGHMDTVFPNGTVEKRPFKKDGNIITGPGCEDMKNGDLAMLEVARTLNKEALDKLNICMCYNPDEEISSVYSKKLLDEIGSRTKVIFVMESAQEDGISHCIGRKGRLLYDIRVTGKAGHAGYIYKTDSANAIEAISHLIIEIQKLGSEERETTVNVGVVNGGTAVNVVPAEAALRVEMRFSKPEEQKRIEDSVDRMINTVFVPGTKAEVVSKAFSPSWSQTEEGLKFIDHVAEIAEKNDLPFKTHVRGGLSDANHLSSVCDIIMDGMGPFGKNAHSDDELTTVDSFEPCVKLLCCILEDAAYSI